MKLKKIYLLLFSILISIVFFRPLDIVQGFNFDYSFQYVYNYLFCFNPIAFSGLKFNTGPLTFLRWPAPLGYNIFISGLFQFVVRTFIAYQLFQLLFIRRISIVLSSFFIGISIAIINFEYLFFCGLLVCMLNYVFYAKRIYLVYSCTFITVALLSRTTISVPCVLLLTSFLLHLLLNKKWYATIYVLSGCIVLYSLLCLPFFGSLSNALSYTLNDFQNVALYSREMVTAPKNNILEIGLFWLGVTLTLFAVERKYLIFYSAIFLPFTFTQWKYIIVRQDFIHVYAGNSLLIFISILLLALSNKNKTAWAAVAVCIYFLGFSILQYNSIKSVYNPVRTNGIFAFYESCVDFKSYTKKRHKALLQDSALRLPETVVRELKNNSCTVYPYLHQIAYNNNIVPMIRPYVSSAINGYKADTSDASYFSSAQAPTYIVWHASTTDELPFQLQGFDNKYLPNENLTSTCAVLNNYSPAYFINSFITVYKKNNTLKQNCFSIVDSALLVWNKKYYSNTENKITPFCKISIEEKPLLKMKEFFYRKENLKINYWFKDGTFKSFALSYRAAKTGFYAFTVLLNTLGEYKAVESFSISSVDSGLINKNMKIYFLNSIPV